MHTRGPPAPPHLISTAGPRDTECWIDSLPNELISEILTAVVSPAPRSDDDRDLMNRIWFPMVAQGVCRRWLYITQATPTLWAILCLNGLRVYDVTQYLQRSGDVPLEVYLDSQSGGPSVESEVERLGLWSLTRRIWKLDVKGDTSKRVQRMVKGWPSEFGNLLDLHIRVDPYHSSDPAQLNLSLPRLRSLHVQHYSLDWTNLPTSAHLEELCIAEEHICSVNITLFLATICAYPQLRILELDNLILTGCQNDALVTLRPFVLERLEELSLKRFYRHELQKIFKFVGTPRVKSLTIRGLSDDSSSPVEYEFTDSDKPLEMKFPVAETLVLEKIAVSTEIAESLPWVRHLTYMYDPYMDDPSDMDFEFGNLLSYWGSLPDPIPLETLKTRGVSLSSLLALFDPTVHDSVPSLRKISVSSRDALPRRGSSEEDIESRAEEREKLAALIELEIYQEGDTDSSRSASPGSDILNPGWTVLGLVGH